MTLAELRKILDDERAERASRPFVPLPPMPEMTPEQKARAEVTLSDRKALDASRYSRL